MNIEMIIPAELSRRLFRQVPMGLLYAATRLREQGHEVVINDLRIRRLEAPFGPAAADLHIVATSEYDTAQCFPEDIGFVRDTVADIRCQSEAPVAIVGSHPTVNGQATCDFTGADHALRGEHEVVIPDFVRAWPEVPQVFPNDEPRYADREEIADLTAPRFDFVEMQHYYNEGVFADQTARQVQGGLVLANRGCPYACSFCHLFFGTKLRKRSIDHVLDEIEIQIIRFGTRNFFFLDYTFTIDERWVMALCDRIRERDLSFEWVCQTRTDRISREMLVAMHAAGCVAMWFGIETPDAALRDGLRKPLVDDEVTRSILLARDCGIIPLAFLMVGFRNESENSLRALNDWISRTGVYYGLAPLSVRPGTPLFDEVYGADHIERHGWNFDDPYAGRLGISALDMSELDWFFDHHRQNPLRLSNAVQLARMN
ncbi:radical SAM protein [uncultured Roseobacter sp.]|uniref:B12-binding domain-containing radical SAM protein n=1 Tax=uncultured Roseobacter sp. TaxID=114847 RepID=UPI002633F348|nr:radical SAM protein [uncultured Roseobacter sp.]